MKRTHSSPGRQLAAVAFLALAASGAAFADDSSMNLLTGDSYAYFHDLDFNAGRFNTAHATGDSYTQKLASPAKPAADSLGKQFAELRRILFVIATLEITFGIDLPIPTDR